MATVVDFIAMMKVTEASESANRTSAPATPIATRRVNIGPRFAARAIIAKAQATPRLRQTRNCQESRCGASRSNIPVKLHAIPAPQYTQRADKKTAPWRDIGAH